MSFEQNPSFLKKKYGDLHVAPDVVQNAKRTEARTGEKVPSDPASRIQNYLNRFQEILDREDPAERERGLDAIKRLMYRVAVVKPENIPESVYLLEQRIAREDGHGTIEITDEFRTKKQAEIINNQKQGLDKWINYLASSDAQYPDWAKYWVFRSMLDMGKLEKQTNEDGQESAVFKRRTKDTVSMFPPLNPRALALTLQALQAKLGEDRKPKSERQPVNNLSKRLSELKFRELLATEDFSKIYTQFLIELPAYSPEGLQETRGEWRVYPQGSDAKPLVKSLEGHPLEWCTAGLETAQSQLQGGDFHVYYSIDEHGKPIIPRVAIRMQEGKIAEVRGIAPGQHLDPYIGDKVKDKMAEFPDGKEYEKKAADMKALTAIEKKTKAGTVLTKAELIFLYEINAKIEGFGYDRDPRINEVRSQRNPNEDAPIMLECQPSEIAWKQEDANEKTRAYFGPLFAGIFSSLISLEHIYTSFPEGKIIKQTIEIGGKTLEQLEAALEDSGCGVGVHVQRMMQQTELTTVKAPVQTDLIYLKVGDLGCDDENPTLDQLFSRASELGLELCPTEAGPYLRIAYVDQPLGEECIMATKPIAGPRGRLGFLHLKNTDYGSRSLNLDFRHHPSDRWGPEGKIVFRVSK